MRLWGHEGNVREDGPPFQVATRGQQRPLPESVQGVLTFSSILSAKRRPSSYL